jgi:hypothetical protein
MAAIEFTWDSRDLEVWRGGKVELALARALSKAGSSAARAMRAESSRKLRERKRMRVGFVNKSLPLVFPTSKEIAQLAWRMNVSGALIPVSAFPHRQTRKGVVVSINQGSSKLIRSAFLVRLKNGHEGVFMRNGRFGRNKNPKLERISEAFTTRVVDVFKDGGFIPAVQARTQGVFASAFARLLPLELGRLRAKGEA